MSSSSTKEPIGFSTYMGNAAAGAVAIIPPFAGFAAKSDLQLGRKIAPITPVQAVKGGLKAAPTISLIVGTQMFLQEKIENAIHERSGTPQPPSFGTMLGSSAAVGAASSPILAIFNGKTAKLPALESLKNFTPQQALAIAVQETSFVASVRISKPVRDVMKRVFGDSKATDASADFASGAIGSAIGHPANTALTRWQNGLKVDNMRQLFWGLRMKSASVGIFVVCYKGAKEFFNPGTKS